MSKITIDDTEIVTDNLSVEGKMCVASVQILEQKIRKAEVEIDICRVAHDTAVDQVKKFIKI